MNSGQLTARFILAGLIVLIGSYYAYTLKPFGAALAPSPRISDLTSDIIDTQAAQSIIGHEKAHQAIIRLMRYIKDYKTYSALGCIGPRGILLYGPDGNGKRLLTRLAASQDCFDHVFTIKAYTPASDIVQCVRMHEDNDAKILLIWEQFDAWLKLHTPEEINGVLDMLMQKCLQGKPVVCIATAQNISDLTTELLQALFERQIPIENPAQEHRALFLERLGQQRPSVVIAWDTDLLSRATYGLSYAQIAAIVDIGLVHFAQPDRSGALVITTQNILDALDIMRKEITKNQDVYTTITFDDVAGMEQVKQELNEVVHLLQHPEAYALTGARLPRGLLLTGDPGNGKTYIARALAGQAGCSFIYISASELHQKYVGESAEKIRKTFAQALAQAPCIMFIDEIDAIGSSRSFGDSAAALAYRETLNQLLTELDGFKVHEKPIFVVAATNKPDDLDHALTRPGRFDRRINIEYPGMLDRKALLEHGLKNIPCDESISIDHFARCTYGLSAVTVTTMCNEAALMAARDGRQIITIADMNSARDRLTMGLENKSLIITPEEKKITAYHEAGHVLTNILNPECTNHLDKVTVVPRGMGLGITYTMPDPEKQSYRKCNFKAGITMMLGGRAAEEIIFVTPSSGASNDLKQATRAAENMICLSGMSDDGLRCIDPRNAGTSEAAKQRIEQEITRVLDEQYQEALKILRENIHHLHALAQALLEKETLTAQEVYALIGKPMPTDLKKLHSKEVVTR